MAGERPVLFEFPPTRSQRAKWVLEELGLRYESHKVDLLAGEQNEQAYRDIHPLGAVPALRTDGYTLLESVAIVLQLIDEHPASGLAPAPGTPERAAYYQWSVFAAAEIDPAIMLYFDNTLRPPEGMRPPGSQHEPRLAERGRFEFSLRAEVLSKVLNNRRHLLSSGFSGADVLIGHSCFMATHVGLIGDYPILQAYYRKLQERPAFKRAYAG